MANYVLKDSDFTNLPILGDQPKNEKEEKYLREIGTYEFVNLEEPGQSVKFSYGSDKKMVSPYLMHGADYRMPRHLVRHIQSREMPIYKYLPDGQGGMSKQRIGYKSRFQMREKFSG